MVNKRKVFENQKEVHSLDHEVEPREDTEKVETSRIVDCKELPFRRTKDSGKENRKTNIQESYKYGKKRLLVTARFESRLRSLTLSTLIRRGDEQGTQRERDKEAD